ncbi:MAG: long-chain acyl-CoA synthetase [Zetaproteobacteria bacterium]|nr:MAG: long-chain acyl-CoA synthetase [Zetaproteobacteria bacterium]
MADPLLQRIEAWRRSRPDHPALEGIDRTGGRCVVRYGELMARARALRPLWGAARCVALLCDTTPDCTLLDLALIEQGMAVVPIPPFFSAGQVHHLLTSAAVECVVTDRPEGLRALLDAAQLPYEEAAHRDGLCAPLVAFRLSAPARRSARHFDKITFTSGSTGTPKGVCLRNRAILTVARSLVQASAASPADRHLALLPYATLLENIGGIYVPLLAGATVIQPGAAAVGMEGSSGLDARRMGEALIRFAATSCIMVPQMLLGLVGCTEAGMRPTRLRFAAVGGAPVSPTLLERAAALGLPVYEGYGLSEAASVVAVNTPAANRIGSVGRPLAHVRLRIADDGELWVAGALMEGYLQQDGASCDADGFWPTGDLASLDDEGFLHLHGRKKQIYITAFGRNIAPEWVERELTIEPAIAQAALFGEGQPCNVAVIVPRDPAGVEAAVARANSRLPDYARVHTFVLADAPFTPANGLASPTGAPLRDQIGHRYREALDACFRQGAHHP